MERQQELYNKKQNYGKFVKEEYMPPVSNKKIEERESNRHKLEQHN